MPPLLAHTLPVKFSAAPMAPRITEKGWGEREKWEGQRAAKLLRARILSRPEVGV